MTVLDEDSMSRQTPTQAAAAQRIPVGIGACLLGHPVRYDGSHKKGSDVLDALADQFEFRPFCPEVAIGLGVPRPTIRLVGPAGEAVAQTALRAVGSPSWTATTPSAVGVTDARRCTR